MKHLLRKILVALLICIPVAEIFISPVLMKAATPAGDPAITGFVITPKKPAASSEVDFLVTYSNLGAGASNDVTLIVDYEENTFKKILVGNPNRCANTGVTVVCNIPTIEPGVEDSIGFTAFVADDAVMGKSVVSYAAIDEPENADDNKQNNFMSVTVEIGTETKASVAAGISATELIEAQEVLEAPSVNQGVSVMDVKSNPNWQESGLFTAGLKFLIRGKEALAWVLNINDSGFHSAAITENYVKVLTIVNSIFIVGLLAIAAMWMFSLLIPRRYLRQVMLLYGIAVIFVNFALPLNQLLIDGTGLLQKVFMSDVNITNIVQVPNYNDTTAVGYQNKAGFTTSTEEKNLKLNVVDDVSQISDNGVVIGRIEQDFLQPSYTGTISTKDGDQTIQLRSTGTNMNVTLNKDQTIGLTNDKVFNPDEEHSIFAFLMLIFTGLAYFGMAVILILRIVILWALMIVSPVLFLLAIFRATRSYFVNWLDVYARWLLIGPLMALGIAIVVHIWAATGLPIKSSYTGFGEFGVLSNVGFYLPGSTTVNTLSNTQQMMEYLMFLIMLYLPILFAFMLTRQKFWSAATTAIAEKRETAKREAAAVQAIPVEMVTKEEKTITEAKSLMGGVKGFLGTQFARITKPSMPESMRAIPGAEKRALESPANLLPRNLILTDMHEMLEMAAGDAKSSRKARSIAIENLAMPESITDETERQKVMTIRQEITERAEDNDPEAISVMKEIEAHVKPIVGTIGGTMGGTIEGAIVEKGKEEPMKLSVTPKIEIEEEFEPEGEDQYPRKQPDTKKPKERKSRREKITNFKF